MDERSAQRGVPGDARARGPTADHEDVGAERHHLVRHLRVGLGVRGAEGGPPTALEAMRPLPDQSNQSKVRVTAFFQYL